MEDVEAKLGDYLVEVGLAALGDEMPYDALAFRRQLEDQLIARLPRTATARRHDQENRPWSSIGSETRGHPTHRPVGWRGPTAVRLLDGAGRGFVPGVDGRWPGLTEKNSANGVLAGGVLLDEAGSASSAGFAA